MLCKLLLGPCTDDCSLVVVCSKSTPCSSVSCLSVVVVLTAPDESSVRRRGSGAGLMGGGEVEFEGEVELLWVAIVMDVKT